MMTSHLQLRSKRGDSNLAGMRTRPQCDQCAYLCVWSLKERVIDVGK